MSNELSNKVALITGASSGIGRSIASTFANAGAHVALAARKSAGLEALAEEIRSTNATCSIHPLDVTESQGVQNVVAEITQSTGRLDILVNNAGIAGFGPLQEITEDLWDRVIAVNLKGAFLCAQAAYRHMLVQKTGVIINISSDVGLRTMANGTAYCASKFGLMGFSGALAKEARAHGVRVSAICPGSTDTAFGDAEAGASDRQWMLRPDDIAAAALQIAAAPPHVLIDQIVLHSVAQGE